jgi:hypothetical protein
MTRRERWLLARDVAVAFVAIAAVGAGLVAAAIYIGGLR